MNPIHAAAVEIQRFCDARSWKSCVIGGLAVQRWGEPRLTRDVDLTIQAGFGAEERYVDALLGSFEARIDDARAFGVERRVLLLRSSSGIPIDVSLGALPFEERAVERSSSFSLESGDSVRTCSAEDLIVFKVFAGRDQDWLDVRTVVIRQEGRLDRELIWRELLPLLELKEDTQSAARLRSIFEEGGLT